MAGIIVYVIVIALLIVVTRKRRAEALRRLGEQEPARRRPPQMQRSQVPPNMQEMQRLRELRSSESPQRSGPMAADYQNQGRLQPAYTVSSQRQTVSSSELKRRYQERGIQDDIRLRRLEDRSNDWLARQMREEARWSRNSCFDFDSARKIKTMHELDCEASEIKRTHAKAHREGRI